MPTTTITNNESIIITSLVGRRLKCLGRLNNVAIRYSATYAADASMNTVYIDVPMPGLPNVNQVMSDVMYDVAIARAKEWLETTYPQSRNPLCPLGTILAQALGLMRGSPWA